MLKQQGSCPRLEPGDYVILKMTLFWERAHSDIVSRTHISNKFLTPLENPPLAGSNNKYTVSKVKYPPGFTLLEIIVATVIFGLVMVGLANIFISAKRYTLHARSRIQAAELGKLFLDPLQMQVRADSWDQINNLLRIPLGQESRSWTGTQEVLDGISFTPNYTVSRVRDSAGNDTGLRRVRVNITWAEPSP